MPVMSNGVNNLRAEEIENKYVRGKVIHAGFLYQEKKDTTVLLKYICYVTLSRV